MKPGMRVAGRFEIEDFMISGGMATIHRARDLDTNEVVAVKILSGRSVRDMERFSAEAVLLAELTHPGIVRYVAHGVLPDGDLYLAMQWLEGEDLSARLLRPQLLSIADTVRLATTIALALGAAHARGIVHRDVKPSNIFLIDGGVEDVKLLDFGIARLGFGRTFATRTGTLLGTPGYMAPEQAQGRKDVDAAADVFSLGAVLFECLTGQPAFTAEHLMATLSRILFEETPRVRTLRPDVPPALDMLITSMLAKDPNARPRDGAHVVAALEAIDSIPEDAVSVSRSVPSVRTRQAITANEQQLLCVVLATAAVSTTISDGAAAAYGGRTLSVARRSTSDLTAKVFLDEVTAGLLDARFDVRNEGSLSLLTSTRNKMSVHRPRFRRKNSPRA